MNECTDTNTTGRCKDAHTLSAATVTSGITAAPVASSWTHLSHAQLLNTPVSEKWHYCEFTHRISRAFTFSAVNLQWRVDDQATRQTGVEQRSNIKICLRIKQQGTPVPLIAAFQRKIKIKFNGSWQPGLNWDLSMWPFTCASVNTWMRWKTFNYKP